MAQDYSAGKLRDPDLRRLRALMMLEYKVKNNATYAETAKEFNVSEDTVQRSLTYAKRAGLIVKFEDQILQELVPEAIKTIKAAILEGNAKVALEVFKGTVPGFKKSKSSNDSSTSGEELNRYIEQMRSELGINGSIDGEIVTGELQKSLPPAKTPETT